MTVFEAYITNLGKYAEGQLVGETLKFPAITEEVQSLLKNIGVDGVLYEEFFITAFDGDVMGLDKVRLALGAFFIEELVHRLIRGRPFQVCTDDLVQRFPQMWRASLGRRDALGAVLAGLV